MHDDEQQDSSDHEAAASRRGDREASDSQASRNARVRRRVQPFAFALTDLAYFLAALITSPFWLIRMWWTGKLRTDWKARLGEGVIYPRTERARVLIHGVSVGEVNAIRGLVARLANDRLRPEIFVSSTTDTGFKRAESLFAKSHQVVRTPFDFTFAMRHWLDRVQPDVIVLVELELWPNMTRLAEARGIPVVVVNGRLSDRSIRRYRRVERFVRGMFERATIVLAQNRASADRFAELGAPEVLVTGNMKWDSIEIEDEVPGSRQLREEFGIPRGVPLIVAGSTEPGEEVLLRDALPEGARLLIAPRKPEWFDGVCANLPGCVRRSRKENGNAETRYFVLDTIGELRMAYALADVVVMGRSFGKLYGSDPIEPASLGKPVVIGPRVADFRDVVEAFVKYGGIAQVEAGALKSTLAELVTDPQKRAEIAFRGRETIRREQGGTSRTSEVLLALLSTRA
ncbi:MAG: 3-deoxy-D-manno-octulosonic acid transferase [Planctomycetota bacterium]|jgi:3-deoxy-D-manno-octulosonic-acid transferase